MRGIAALHVALPLAMAGLCSLPVRGQALTPEVEAGARREVEAYLRGYRSSTFVSDDPIRLTGMSVDEGSRTLRIEANEGFAAQPFTKDIVGRIKRDIALRLPPPLTDYTIELTAGGASVEELVPREWDDRSLPLRHWTDVLTADPRTETAPWVRPVDNPLTPRQGLYGTHLSLWASHGRYYNNATDLWRWQRPRLFTTAEDLYTQSIVVPFLMPMLERAGAVVFSPRERDWQRSEAVIDNDSPSTSSGSYRETPSTYPWRTGQGTGFAWRGGAPYLDKENPFTEGTYRMAETVSSPANASTIEWQPLIPEEGDYAVYVSYASLPNSVSDALYTVRHEGVETRFLVNQRMGGGTWAYLGTFHFQEGETNESLVSLSNVSGERGVVTADGVRFGGGMGNIARSDSLHYPHVSRLPRYLEGSRYAAQWGGMPYPVYGTKESLDDYGEDINARSLMTDHLARGSRFLPGDSGLCVPIELSLAIHSDAGYRRDNSLVGSLGIYTSGNHTPTGDYEGVLREGFFPSGLSRMASRDLCDRILTSITSDMGSLLGHWTRRQTYDKNYSETREPLVPGAIIETLSHQNWADLRYGHDPWFKFLLARSIYKGTLRTVAALHGRPSCVVQPLPVSSMAAVLDESGDSVTISWRPTPDPLEPSAMPTGYILRTATGEAGYDNGVLLTGTSTRLAACRGQIMRFRLTATNDGGESLESAELCAYSPKGGGGKRLLIVNAFTRLAGPQPVNTPTRLGFDMDIDPGVVYQRQPCYSGRQQEWDPASPSTLGQSGAEYEGLLVAGNTMDYPTLHCRDLVAMGIDVAISSCSGEAFTTGQVRTTGIDALDYILGAQRNDGYSLRSRPTFPPSVCLALSDFASCGGALLISGAYIAEELNTAGALSFASSTLHLSPQGSYPLTDGSLSAEGMGTSLSVASDLNERVYCVKRLSVLSPSEEGFCTMLYPGTRQPAAVAYDGGGARTLTFGFPLEAIESPQTRGAVLAASLRFLLEGR